MENLVGNKKALSPVIATVILVSVTIVVAIAVAYWMGSIAGLYTRFEKIEISACYAVKEPATGDYSVTVQLKNSGSQDASITYVLVNGKPSEEYLADGIGQITVTWTTVEKPTGEAVGTGDGADNQVFSVDHYPVTADTQKINVAGELWTEVTAWTDATKEYMFNDATGTITFGTVASGDAPTGAITADYTYVTGTGTLPEDSMTIPLGKSGTIKLLIKSGLYDPGTTLDLKFHSAAGKDYPQMLSLP